jgi:hypothetical protein
MAFAAIAPAAVDDFGTGHRGNSSGGPIDGVAGCTTRAAESRVVGNAPGNHRVKRLAWRCLQASSKGERRHYDEAYPAHQSQCTLRLHIKGLHIETSGDTPMKSHNSHLLPTASAT